LCNKHCPALHCLVSKNVCFIEESDADEGGGLDIDEFREAMKRTMGSEIDDRQLELIFMKVDTNCDGTVDWVSFKK